MKLLQVRDSRERTMPGNDFHVGRQLGNDILNVLRQTLDAAATIKINERKLRLPRSRRPYERRLS